MPPCCAALEADSGGCTDAGAKALAASPHLHDLPRLNLGGQQIGPDGAEALTDPSTLPNLEDLQLWCNPIGGRGGAAPARWCRRRQAGRS